MKKLTLTLETVTPLFLGGADTQAVVLRAQPFRGQLRYWLRAMLGGQGKNAKEDLRTAESEIFGDTKGGSGIIVRVGIPQGKKLQQEERLVVPHSREFRNKAFWNGQDQQEILFELLARPGLSEIPNEALKAFLLWANLGGAGKRARRGFGSFRVSRAYADVDVFPEGFERALYPRLPSDGYELSAQLTNTLHWSLGASVHSSSTPEFPTFIGGQTKVLVCRKPHPGDYENAMKTFWNNNLRNDARGLMDNRAYGYATGGRRASPFHLHLARSERGYHYILTAFNARPSPSHSSWDKVQALLASCASDYDGQYIW